jgi:hypothetical protein
VVGRLVKSDQYTQLLINSYERFCLDLERSRPDVVLLASRSIRRMPDSPSNPQVAGSSPAWRTNVFHYLYAFPFELLEQADALHESVSTFVPVMAGASPTRSR